MSYVGNRDTHTDAGKNIIRVADNNVVVTLPDVGNTTMIVEIVLGKLKRKIYFGTFTTALPDGTAEKGRYSNIKMAVKRTSCWLWH